MGEKLSITSGDGFAFDCYAAGPAGAPKGGILIIQEIFGVNSHIRDVADGYAADGYLAYAPALYDRVEKDFQVEYTPEDIARGRDVRAKLPWEDAVRDMAAAVGALGSAGVGRIGSVGYCWGGSCSFLVATRIGVGASVCYYGGQIAPFKDEKARNPLMMHFGENDHGIPMGDVEAIRAAQPDAEVHIYPAGHGFNCDRRGDWHEASATLARERTLAFFARHVG